MSMTALQIYIKELASLTEMDRTSRWTVFIPPRSKCLEITQNEVDTLEDDFVILLELLESTLDGNVCEMRFVQSQPLRQLLADFKDNLVHLDFEFQKMLIVLLKIFELIFRNDHKGAIDAYFARICSLFSTIHQKHPEIELSGYLVIWETSLMKYSNYDNWYDSFYSIESNPRFIKEESTKLQDWIGMLLELLEKLKNSTRSSLVLMNMIGFLLSTVKANAPETLFIMIDDLVNLNWTSDVLVFLHALSCHVYQCFIESNRAIHYLPNLFHRLMQSTMDSFLDTNKISFGPFETLKETIVTVTNSFKYLLSNRKRAEFLFLVMQYILRNGNVSDMVQIVLFSKEWESIRKEQLLVLLVIIKGNVLQGNLEEVFGKVIDLFIDDFIAKRSCYDVTCEIIQHLSLDLPCKIRIINICLERAQMSKGDLTQVVWILNFCISDGSILQEMKQKLSSLAISLIEAESVKQDVLCRFVTCLLHHTSLADVFSTFFSKHYSQGYIENIVRYAVSETKHDRFFALLSDIFSNLVLERITKKDCLDDLSLYLSALFRDTKVNPHFVIAMSHFDFIGNITRLVSEISVDSNPAAFLSFVNLLGKILSYDLQFVEDFVNCDGYQLILKEYLKRKDSLDVTVAFTPILFKQRGELLFIMDSAGIEFIIDLIDTIESQYFLQLISLIIANCTEDNLWNLEQCRVARVAKSLLLRSDYFSKWKYWEQYWKFLVALLSYHSEFEDVKLLMSSLAADPHHQRHVLEIMHTIVSHDRKGSPSEFFILSGPESVFELPTFRRDTLNSTGFSVMIWLRFPSQNFSIFEMNWIDSNYTMKLTTQGSHLCIRTIESDIIKDILVGNALEINHWYRITLTHKVGMFNVSTDCLYLDGQQIWKGSVLNSVIHADLQLQVALQSSQIHYPFYVASFAFFNQVIPPETIRTIYFEKDFSLPVSSELYQFQLLPESQQPLVFLHPLSVHKENYCYNLSSNVEAAQDIKIKRIRVAKRTLLSEALQCVGSVELFYPLFEITESRHSELGIVIPENTQHPSNVIHLIKLIGSLVKRSSFHRAKYIQSHGTKLISLLLQKIPVSNVNGILLEQLLYYRESCHDYPEIVDTIDEKMIFEPQIWSRCSITTQREYFSRILPLVVGSKKYDIAYWLDSVEQFYSGISKESGTWELSQTMLSNADDSRDVDRFSESLWCCINSSNAMGLYSLFDYLYYANPSFYEMILERNGIELILRLCQSEQKTVRLRGFQVCLKIISGGDIYTGSLEEELARIDDIVWVDLLSPYVLDRETVHHLLSLSVATVIPANRDVNSWPVKLVKYPRFLKVLIDLFGKCRHEDGSLCNFLEILQGLIRADPDNSLAIKDSNSLIPLLQLIRTADICEGTKEFNCILGILIETLFITENPTLISSTCLIEVVSMALFTLASKPFLGFLYGLLSLLFDRLDVILLLDPSGEAPNRLQQTIAIIEDFLFYHKDIASGFAEYFGETLGTFGATYLATVKEPFAQQQQRRPSATRDLIYQPCYPFEEWKQGALRYSQIVQLLLRKKCWLKSSRFFVFSSNESQQSLVISSIRIILSSLAIFDAETWSISLDQLNNLADDAILSTEWFITKYSLYVLGNLFDSSKSDGKYLIYPCMIKLMGLWEHYALETDPTLNPVTWRQACTDVSVLEEYLQSNDWMRFYDKYLYNAMRLVENDIIGSAQQITRKYLTTAKAQLHSFSQRANEKDQNSLILLRRVNDMTISWAEGRKERLSRILTNYEQDNKQITKTWQTAIQEVAYERRVWNNSAKPRQYSLDNTENRFRMRIRLSSNFDGDNHEAASLRRDRQPKDDIATRKSSPFLSLPYRTKIFGRNLSKINLESGLAIDGPDESSVGLVERMVLEKSRNYETQSEICLYSVECELVLYLARIKGKIEVTTSNLRFIPDNSIFLKKEGENDMNVHLEELKAVAEHHRPLSSLTKVFYRKYNLQDSAIEAFFNDGQNFMFNFLGTGKEAEKQRRILLNILKGLKMRSPVSFFTKSPSMCLEMSGFTSLWCDWKISNFEYLMILNTFSGRTFNDLSQYPVFPWIISDYSSTFLNLNHPNTFRDLSKPMGAINPDRLAYFLERYQSFEDPSGEIPKFLYGSHYSSSAIAMFYLLRLEPFTSLHVSLQGGKFDHADRQFYSFENLWHSVTTSTSDVKELIPEFFYLPDFLRNVNGYDLGWTQSGEKVDDVILPPWASSPEEFIRLHRKALESDYVSENLNHWIDLIWGYKQRGEHAIAANNVFYYLTYEGSIKMDAIESVDDRKSVEDQINHFGQTPSQLFKIPHPVRSPKPEQRTRQFDIQEMEIENENVFYLYAKFVDNMLVLETVDKEMTVRTFRLKPIENSYNVTSTTILSKPVTKQFTHGTLFKSNLLQIHPQTKFLFCAGYFDNTFRFHKVDTELVYTDRIYGHLDVVTCLRISSDGALIATGSKDTTVRLWKVHAENNKCTVHRDHKIFYGHSLPVTDILLSIDSHVLVTTDTNTVLIHPLHHSESPTCIELEANEVKLYQFPICGDLLILKDGKQLYRYSINGRLLNKLVFKHVNDIKISPDEKVVAISTLDGIQAEFVDSPGNQYGSFAIGYGIA